LTVIGVATFVLFSAFLYTKTDPKHSKKLNGDVLPSSGELFKNEQGLMLYTNEYYPQEKPVKGEIFLVHGLLEHSGRYSELIQLLNDHQYLVRTIDLQGHGRSDGDPAYVEHYEHWMAEIIQWIQQSKKQEDTVPRFLLGHSNGGLVSLLVTLNSSQLVDGLILSAPAIDVEPSSDVVRSIIGFVSSWFPKLRVASLDNGKLSKVADTLEKIEKDVLHHKGWILTARTVFNLLTTGRYVKDHASDIKIPFIVMHGTEDTIIPISGSRVLFSKASSTDKTLKEYDGYYHEIFNEEGRAKVFEDLFEWLEKHSTKQ